MTLGEYIIKERIKRNLSQRKLASELNITQASLCNFEKDKRVPSYINIGKIAEYFGVSTNKIRKLIDNVD